MYYYVLKPSRCFLHGYLPVLGENAQEGLLYSCVCLSVCYSTSPYMSDQLLHKQYVVFSVAYRSLIETVWEALEDKHPHPNPVHPDVLLGDADDNSFHPTIFDSLTAVYPGWRTSYARCWVLDRLDWMPSAGDDYMYCLWAKVQRPRHSPSKSCSKNLNHVHWPIFLARLYTHPAALSSWQIPRCPSHRNRSGCAKNHWPIWYFKPSLYPPSFWRMIFHLCTVGAAKKYGTWWAVNHLCLVNTY